MNPTQVDRFFSELAKEWRFPAKILITGGAAALLWGGARPTEDVDFEVIFLASSGEGEQFNRAVAEAARRSGILGQFAESIDRWSTISLLDYREHTKRYRRFGSLEVHLIDPAYWAIPKIGRYWDRDVQDLVTVFKKTKPDPFKVAQLLKRALEESPKSTDLFLFKKHVQHFFKTFGREIWGERFPSEEISRLFL